MDQWYLAKDGAQEGPLTSPQIAALVKAGAINPTSALVWREGMADWKPITESGILAASSTAELPTPTLAPAPSAPAQAPFNPYHVTERTRSTLSDRHTSFPLEYPGYGRLRYFLMHMAIVIVGYFILFAVFFAMLKSESMGGSIVAILLFSAIIVAAGIYVSVQRVINLGMSGWAVLWSFVPFMNIWIAWRMVACPAGYEDTRTLDLTGKVITGVFIGFFVLGIVANIVAAIARS